MGRRIGFPFELLGIEPGSFADPSLDLPENWLPRGRWSSGPLHTFCDDYRQEFFWRRPSEGLIVALTAGICTAPDFTIYGDDPAEWASYQVWRSALVAGFWASHGVTVLPVVTFSGSPGRFVAPGSLWATRGPGRSAKRRAAWDEGFKRFCDECEPAKVVVFGNVPEGDYGVMLESRKLSPIKKEG